MTRFACTRINCKLFVNYRYHRNQPVFIEGKDVGKVNAVITAIGTQEVSQDVINVIVRKSQGRFEFKTHRVYTLR